MAFSHANKDGKSLTYQWAERLAKALRAKGKYKRVPNLDTWEQQFKFLRQTATVDAIESVLSWYEKHIGEETMIQAYSAASFRLHFSSLMEKMQETTTDDNPIKLRNQKLAEYLQQEMELPTWMIAVLPELVQKTQENWDKFCQRMLDFQPPGRNFIFLTYVLEEQAPIFVTVWFRNLVGRYNWMSYHNAPLGLAFKPDSPIFLDLWRGWSYERSQNLNAFDALLEELKKETTCK